MNETLRTAMQEAEEAVKALEAVKTICENHRKACSACPFFSAEESACSFEYNAPYEIQVSAPVWRVVV